MSIADAQYNDDQYNYDANAQSNAPAEILLMPGVYEVSAQVWEAKYRGGENKGQPVIFRDDSGNEWPNYVIPSIEVTQPMDESGRFNVWHDVKTIPSRFNENEPYKSEGAILLRAVDAERAEQAGSFGNAAKEVAALQEGGTPITFKVSTALEGFDSTYFNAELEKLGPNPDKKAVNELRKKSKVKNAAFQIAKGTKTTPATYATTTTKTPSGKAVKARVVLKTFIPSNVECELGRGKFPPKQ